MAVEVEDGGKRVVAVSAIDNLVKGASGQAIQNMNLMCGCAEPDGLMVVPPPTLINSGEQTMKVQDVMTPQADIGHPGYSGKQGVAPNEEEPYWWDTGYRR